MKDCETCIQVIRYVSMGLCGTAGNASLSCKIQKQVSNDTCSGYEEDTSGKVYNAFGATIGVKS